MIIVSNIHYPWNIRIIWGTWHIKVSLSSWATSNLIRSMLFFHAGLCLQTLEKLTTLIFSERKFHCGVWIFFFFFFKLICWGVWIIESPVFREVITRWEDMKTIILINDMPTPSIYQWHAFPYHNDDVLAYLCES